MEYDSGTLIFNLYSDDVNIIFKYQMTSILRLKTSLQ